MEQIFTFHSYINSIRGVSSRLHIDSLTKLNITRIKVFLGLENVPTAFDEQQKIYSSGSVTVIRVRLVGELPNGTTATDLALKVTQVPLFTTKITAQTLVIGLCC